jgi:hypothetical protein
MRGVEVRRVFVEGSDLSRVKGVERVRQLPRPRRQTSLAVPLCPSHLSHPRFASNEPKRPYVGIEFCFFQLNKFEAKPAL